MQHTHPHHSGVGTLILGATGVVFGDIGTSPIYALHETFAKTGTELADIYGVVSMVFWVLTLVVTVKYLGFVMRADNRGEGGILALLGVLPQSFQEGTTRRGRIVMMLILVGTALLFGDGVITPAISVLSATEGLELVSPTLAGYAVPITAVVLTALFMVQRQGTHRIGRVFGPVMVTWFLMIAGLGLYRFLQHPEVIQALSPVYALEFIGHHGFRFLLILSSIILCVTGAEALYADMGHFGRRPIQLAWLWLVWPSLILCYLGQAAVVANNPDAARNPFFSLTPNAAWTFALVLLATAATVIASQALITGIYSLARQATQLGLFPRMQVHHTNVEQEGQIYVPLVNFLAGIASVSLVLLLKTSSALADAYVLAIAGTMTVTTLAFHNVARVTFGWSRARTWPLTAAFMAMDLSFLLGTAGNIFKGGWIPIVLGAAVFAVMVLWQNGFKALRLYMVRNTVEWEHLLDELEHGSVHRSPGIGIFMAAPKERVPAALASEAKALRSIPSEIYVVTVESVQQPTVQEKPIVTQIAPRITKVAIKAGYMDAMNVSDIMREHVLGNSERVATYYISERRFLATDANLVKRLPEALFSAMHRNSAPVVQYYGLPGDRVISIGTRIDL